jgi:hypothetical protein
VRGMNMVESIWRFRRGRTPNFISAEAILGAANDKTIIINTSSINDVLNTVFMFSPG